MKKIIMAALAIFTAAICFADPAEGDLGDLTVVGTTWIWDLKNKGEGVWADGFVIDPDDGNRYKCKITFHKADGGKYKADTLEMRGEIGMGIGRSQYWKSATAEDIENMKK